jgi:hypothetical protein
MLNVLISGHCNSIYYSLKPGRLRLKCDGTLADTRFRLLTKRTSPFKSVGATIQSTTGRRAVHISLQGLYCSCKPVFYSHVKRTGYPFHFLVSTSLLLPCVTVCHHIQMDSKFLVIKIYGTSSLYTLTIKYVLLAHVTYVSTYLGVMKSYCAHIIPCRMSCVG